MTSTGGEAVGSGGGKRRILIAYHTRTGNTVKVAKAIAAAVGAELVHVDSVTEEQLRGWDYIGLGSGVYWLRHDKKIFALASKIPRGTKVFTFSTSGLKNWLAVTFYKLVARIRLRRRGLLVVGQWHCPGHDLHPLVKPFNLNKGRPHSGDLDAAAQFAKALCD